MKVDVSTDNFKHEHSHTQMLMFYISGLYKCGFLRDICYSMVSNCFVHDNTGKSMYIQK